MTTTDAPVAATTQAAVDAIGHNEPGDYRLDPKQHADSLPDSAAALRRVLQEPSVLATIDGYDTFDEQAGAAQLQYKRICKRTLVMLALASIVGLIAAVAPWSEPYDGFVRWGAIAFVYSAMIIAFLSLRTLDRAQPYKRWHQKRANAELMRGQLFKAVVNAAPVGAARQGEIELLPLKLEYFRRYHLDVQQAYYTKRAREHRRKLRAADRWRKVGALAIIVWVVCVIVTAITPIAEPMPALTRLQSLFGLFEWVETTYLDAVLLGVGLCVMVGYGLALANSSINNDLRNAGRYAAYAKRVENFSERLPEMRRLALDPGNADKVSAFVAEVQDLFDTEHRDWKLMQEIEDREPPAQAKGFSWDRLNPFRPRPVQGSTS